MFFLGSFSLEKPSGMGPFCRCVSFFPQLFLSQDWITGVGDRPAPFAIPFLMRCHLEGTKLVSALLE